MKDLRKNALSPKSRARARFAYLKSRGFSWMRLLTGESYGEREREGEGVPNVGAKRIYATEREADAYTTAEERVKTLEPVLWRNANASSLRINLSHVVEIL